MHSQEEAPLSKAYSFAFEFDEYTFPLIEQKRFLKLWRFKDWLLYHSWNGREHQHKSQFWDFQYKKRNQSHQGYKRIGQVQLNPERIIFQLHGGEEVIPFDQIHRINVYWNHGMDFKRYYTDPLMDAFKKIHSMRLRIRLLDNTITTLLVPNNELNEHELGALYQLLNALRKVNIQYHQKIQFWAKY